MVTTSLKSFIKSVKASKTIADERSIIQRESALIRTAFKDTQVSHQTRRVNIQKLLYLYILGEKTHFGQIECIKLLASPNFVDKRLGYLATMLILDENQEVLTLLTNSLNNDMNHPNQFIVSLALSTLGNICSPELARDLYTDVETVLSGNNNYLKKKAALVASKIVEKDPDLSEIFEAKVSSLLECPDHGVLLGTLRLIRSLYEMFPESRLFLIAKVPQIIDTLKDLLKDLNPEYAVSGVADPFLLISLIQTLRLIFTDEEHISATSQYNETFHDVLTSIASYSSYSSSSAGSQAKNAGSAVLHETVKTIFTIPHLDPALKVLGINTLGQLLGTKDNNNRYVALDTFLSVVDIEPLAVQRHRSTIVACLNDQDISIKRRALELSFAILDANNIRILIKEILAFLENPVNNDKELKNYITRNVTNILERKELIPNQKWKFDILARLANLSGDTLTAKISSQLLSLIMNIPDNDELKSYTINKLFKAAYEDSSKDGLNMIVVYLVGEYGDLLLKTSLSDDKKITDLLLTSYLIDLSHLKNDDPALVSFTLTAALKLSTKITDSISKSKLKNYIESKTKSDSLNVQIKAVSYSVLFDEPDSIKRGVLDRMPAPVIKEKETISLTSKTKPMAHAQSTASTQSRSISNTEDLLLDLMDDSSVPDSNKIAAKDLLGDIFGNSDAVPQTTLKNDILDLFGSTTTAVSPQPPTGGTVAFENDRIKVSFLPKIIGNGQAVVETVMENKATQQLSGLQLLIAVPKTQKLTMSSISSLAISPNGYVTQDLKIVGTSGSKIKLRVKVAYDAAGTRHSEQFDYGGFSQAL
jgi:AP-1 complex subunit gamma-1